MDDINVLIAGIGGQGIVAASDIIAGAGMLAGYDVKKTDSLGMAQRGGSVVSHIRMGEQVSSPLIGEGEAHYLMALEKLEAARWSSYLRPEGYALINDLAVSPPSVTLGEDHYPADHEITYLLKQRTQNLYFIPGSEEAEKMGEPRALNAYMLGSLSCFLALTKDIWLKSLKDRLPAESHDINIKAFNSGRYRFFRLLGIGFDVRQGLVEE
jgi:indolepyruvate ferredoxin oxidoreductase beta subunit